MFPFGDKSLAHHEADINPRWRENMIVPQYALPAGGYRCHKSSSMCSERTANFAGCVYRRTLS
jgi:hypothetical protein